MSTKKQIEHVREPFVESECHLKCACVVDLAEAL